MKNLKILIVDDDPVTRLLLNKKLKMAEYEFETAENGVEALNILSKCGFDVVLTDLMMPGGVDGIGVLEAVKEKYTRTEVILLTAFASVENAVEAMKKGAADYLQKPINFDELFLRLDKISNLKKLAKDATDLREAMDVTERNAARTIQALEFMVSELQHKFSEIKRILSEDSIDPHKCIKSALKMLASFAG
ncbi:MAG: hypothetical protein BA864_08565 [Desulfuromonadales bacterium C00003093]|nr:MAG: hypothetical protein BA864_08565 [Desulfuromonadales bacterium C00003093]